MFREDDDDYFESRESRDPDLWHWYGSGFRSLGDDDEV